METEECLVMGRHREFEPEVALDAALDVFWRKGFEGTSFSDLTEVTGVARPGLYAVFGNKEELFLKALDRYGAKYMGFMSEALERPTPRAVVEHILRGSVEVQTQKAHPHGCLGVNGAIACSDEGEPIRQLLIKGRSASELALRRRLEQAKSEGQLALDSDPGVLARYVMTVSQGMAVQAKAGVSRRELHKVVDQTMRMWPSE
jgi:AcrR family transcriptional regulator